jgi:uncharacterized protein
LITIPRFGLFNTEERILHSDLVGQDYQIGIWLPFSYAQTDKKYPVLYVTDGDFAFGLATGLIPTLIGAQEVPEMLVVGIAYHGITSWSEQGALRTRDFLTSDFQNAPTDSRLEQFTSFFQQELFPLVETEYRGEAGDRTIFGFSSGGFFALHCLLTRPGMFRRIIAASCTWPEADDHLLGWEQAFSQESMLPPADLYLAVGELEEEQLPGYCKVVERLQGRNYPGLRLFTQIWTGENHSSGVLAKTFLEGVRTVFN